MNDQNKPTPPSGGMSRRAFLNGAALAAAGVAIVPRRVLGGPGFIAPSDTVNVATVGVGGMGRGNTNAVAKAGHNIVALCDIDDVYAAKTYNAYPNAKRYVDYRKMLEGQKDIDAVVVATPDHTHAVITLAAMQMGKHVYVQKPLTWSVREARELEKAARQYKVVTQMGNQGHSGDGTRQVVEWIRDGAIGPVREVHIWTNRPIWPQGIDRPTGTTPPDTLAWDLFLGPAPYRPYDPAYTPFKWRGWVDWGTGALGDMGAHLVDQPFWALKLGFPTTVETFSTKYNKESWPLGTITYYDFPARDGMPPVKLTWTDSGLFPQTPEEMKGEELPKEGGVIYVGDKGKLMHLTYGNEPRLLPKSLDASYKRPAPTLKRIPGGTAGHEQNWLDAIQGKQEISCPFSYAAPLTETMLLGLVALHAGKKIEYDGANMRVTNMPEANDYLHRTYRDGWTLS